jgi:hypothetical protein
LEWRAYLGGSIVKYSVKSLWPHLDSFNGWWIGLRARVTLPLNGIWEIGRRISLNMALSFRRPSVNEPRYGILGLTSEFEHVFVCFTIRGSGLRIIHIRRMNKKERRLYAELCKE